MRRGSKKGAAVSNMTWTQSRNAAVAARMTGRRGGRRRSPGPGAQPNPQLDVGTFSVREDPLGEVPTAWAWRSATYSPVTEAWALFHPDSPEGFKRPSEANRDLATALAMRLVWYPAQHGNQDPFSPETINAFSNFGIAHSSGLPHFAEP